MTTELGRALRALADTVPAAEVPPDLFDRARSARRRRLAVRAAAGAVVLLLLGIAYAVGPLAGPRGGVDGAESAPGVPSRLVAPPLRTATVGQSAPGAAAAVFGGSATTDNWNEGRIAVVAADADRYRVVNGFPYRPPGFEALLSPDGRYVAFADGLESLTGDDAPGFEPGGVPLAFSPDGSLLVTQATQVAVGGAGTNEILVYRLRDREPAMRVDVGGQWLLPGWSAAVSPDNAALALQVRDEVWLFRLDATRGPGRPPAAPYERLPLPDGARLAGPGAWLPGGDELVVAERRGDGWQLSQWSATLAAVRPGRQFPALAGTRYVRTVGWRSPDTVLALVGVPASGAGAAPADDYDNEWGPFRDGGTGRVRLVAWQRGAPAPEVLLETPAGVTELDVAAAVALGGVRPAGRPSYGPPHPYFLVAGLCVLVEVLGLAVVIRWLVGRRRGRRADARRLAAQALRRTG